MTDPLPGRGRFAPSPSGPLHLGNLRTALLAWLFARSVGSTFVLRNDDIDQARVRPDALETMIRDLHWLGIDWDEGPDRGGPYGPYSQSERTSLYAEHMQRLIEQDLVYPCYCSRSDIAQAASAPHGAPGSYPGICRDPVTRERQRLAHLDRLPCYRFRTMGGKLSFEDRLHGTQTVRLSAEADDFVVWRADGTPSYQLATVVDDALMRIGEVVRGDDLLDSTPRQMLLYQAFGYAVPYFAHVPLLRDERGARMAKRDGIASLDGLRAGGASPSMVVGILAASCGIAPADAYRTPHQLLPNFVAWRIGG